MKKKQAAVQVLKANASDLSFRTLEWIPQRGAILII